MNEQEHLQKHTLLPATDEKALLEMIDMFSLLEELPLEKHSESVSFGVLRSDQVHQAMEQSALCGYFSAFSPDGIAMPSILPAKEENA